MQLETVVERRVLPDKKSKRNKLVVVGIIISNIVLIRFLPFYFGFSFAKTQSLLFLFLFLISMFFDVRLEYDNNIRIKVVW